MITATVLPRIAMWPTSMKFILGSDAPDADVHVEVRAVNGHLVVMASPGAVRQAKFAEGLSKMQSRYGDVFRRLAE